MLTRTAIASFILGGLALLAIGLGITAPGPKADAQFTPQVLAGEPVTEITGEPNADGGAVGAPIKAQLASLTATCSVTASGTASANGTFEWLISNDATYYAPAPTGPTGTPSTASVAIAGGGTAVVAIALPGGKLPGDGYLYAEPEWVPNPNGVDGGQVNPCTVVLGQ